MASDPNPYAPPTSTVATGETKRSMGRETMRITGLFLLGAIALFVYIFLTSFGAPYWTKLVSLLVLAIPFVPVLRRHHIHRSGIDRGRATWIGAALHAAFMAVAMLWMLDLLRRSGA